MYRGAHTEVAGRRSRLCWNGSRRHTLSFFARNECDTGFTRVRDPFDGPQGSTPCYVVVTRGETIMGIAPLRRSLDLAPIGNGRIAALVDTAGRIVWWCFPRFDGDPVFCALLANGAEKGF